jgi:hypothetical protein
MAPYRPIAPDYDVHPFFAWADFGVRTDRAEEHLGTIPQFPGFGVPASVQVNSRERIIGAERKADPDNSVALVGVIVI